MNAQILHLLLLFPFVFSNVAPLGEKETLRIVREAAGNKGTLGRRIFPLQPRYAGDRPGVFIATGDVSQPVQLGQPMTLSCNSNQALDLCIFKPPLLGYGKTGAQVFDSSTQLDGGRIKLSKRSVRDPRVCEILVDKVEEKDLGKWRCVIRSKGASFKGIVFDVLETQAKPGYEELPPPPTQPAYRPPKTTKPAYKPPVDEEGYKYKPPPPTKPAYKPPAKLQKLVQLKPKRALLSSTYISKRYNLPAKNCIDGKYNYYISQLCHTKAWGSPHVGEPAPWFALDNGVHVSVAKTVLINRKDCCWKRTRNVEVRLSDQLPVNGQKMFTGGHLLGTFAGPGRSGQRIEIDSEKDWEGLSGRYLIIQMDNGKDPLNLREVFAFGKRSTNSPRG